MAVRWIGWLRRRRSAGNGARGDRGFTLLEVTIAMGILAFGLLSVAAMQIHALRGGRVGRHTTQAMVIAQDQMERFQRTSFTGMNDTTGNWVGNDVVDNEVESGGTLIEQSYTVDWRITDEVIGWTKLVDVRVTWSEPERPNREYVLTSRRYNW